MDSEGDGNDDERFSRRRLRTVCHYCRCRVYGGGAAEVKADPSIQATRDHVVPKIEGGNETVTACALCNQVKGDDPYEAFVAFIETSPPRRYMRAAYRVFRRELWAEALDIRAKREAEEDARLDAMFDADAAPASPKPRFTRFNLRDLRKQTRKQTGINRR